MFHILKSIISGLKTSETVIKPFMTYSTLAVRLEKSLPSTFVRRLRLGTFAGETVGEAWSQSTGLRGED